MKQFDYQYPTSAFALSEMYFTEETMVLDIETTGFSSKYNPIYLIGLAGRCQNDITITLLLAESHKEESLLLETFLKKLNTYKKIVTFNGDRFDLPFLTSRLKHHGLSDESLRRLSSVDLLPSVRRLKNTLHLSHCDQKNVELFLGIHREDPYHGGELIEIYHDYEKEPSQQNEHLLIQHNHDDIYGLIRLLPMLSYEQLKQAPLTLSDTDWDWEEGFLYAAFTSNATIPKAFRIHESSFHLIAEENRLKTALPLYQGQLNYFFPTPSQYVYLIREDMIIPKSLASTIPASEKRKPKQEECCSKVTGSFIGIEKKIYQRHPDLFADMKSFRKQFQDNELYIKADPITANPYWIRDYVGLLLDQYL